MLRDEWVMLAYLQVGIRKEPRAGQQCSALVLLQKVVVNL